MNDADEIHVEANEGCGAYSETQTQPKQDHTTEPQRAPPPAPLPLAGCVWALRQRRFFQC